MDNIDLSVIQCQICTGKNPIMNTNCDFCYEALVSDQEKLKILMKRLEVKAKALGFNPKQSDAAEKRKNLLTEEKVNIETENRTLESKIKQLQAKLNNQDLGDKIIIPPTPLESNKSDSENFIHPKFKGLDSLINSAPLMQPRDNEFFPTKLPKNPTSKITRDVKYEPVMISSQPNVEKSPTSSDSKVAKASLNSPSDKVASDINHPIVAPNSPSEKISPPKLSPSCAQNVHTSSGNSGSVAKSNQPSPSSHKSSWFGL
ncbi:hypothetical protein THRCLA_08747 [Thraustotheca clavata]|uniref:Uncharacterized protein n=1 Tax=Thraustotheca clavata TaxID=74557 RepID=A0A1V9Z2T2_9STRA|nr:hypothetical protein THRCLA_08747 [Thraustotheca clavata]